MLIYFATNTIYPLTRWVADIKSRRTLPPEFSHATRATRNSQLATRIAIGIFCSVNLALDLCAGLKANWCERNGVANWALATLLSPLSTCPLLLHAARTSGCLLDLQQRGGLSDSLTQSQKCRELQQFSSPASIAFQFSMPSGASMWQEQPQTLALSHVNCQYPAWHLVKWFMPYSCTAFQITCPKKTTSNWPPDLLEINMTTPMQIFSNSTSC